MPIEYIYKNTNSFMSVYLLINLSIKSGKNQNFFYKWFYNILKKFTSKKKSIYVSIFMCSLNLKKTNIDRIITWARLRLSVSSFVPWATGLSDSEFEQFHKSYNFAW